MQIVLFVINEGQESFDICNKIYKQSDKNNIAADMKLNDYTQLF